MSTYGKVISGINLVYLIGLLVSFSNLSALMAIMSTTIGVGLLFLFVFFPLLLGVIYAIRFHTKKKNAVNELPKFDKILVKIPLINLVIILVSAIVLFLFTI